MHVHLDRASIEPLTLSKLLMFFNRPQMFNLLQGIGGRSVHPSHARWCKAHPDTKGSDIIKIPSDRYRSLNLVKERTAEIRIYGSTTDYNQFMTRLEFSHAAVMFCKQASLRDISTVEFLTWLEKADDAYPFLSSFCKQKRKSLI